MAGGKLVILAGGISSRMKKAANSQLQLEQSLINDADFKAKSMIGVGKDHRPFLDYLLFNAREVGYTNVLIVIGEKDDSVRGYYGEKMFGNEFHGLKISYAVQNIPPGREKPIGTADALFQALNAVKDWRGHKFTVCNSDNLYSKKALKLMLEHTYKNAMIDYDRNALEFERSRISKFAVTLKDDQGYLTGILEKPSDDQIKGAQGADGFVGVSMNIFGLQYDMILPYLENVPFNAVRNEKELPEAITMMIKEHPKSLFAFPLSEHVPDLTAKSDILPVKRYLETHFAHASF